VIKHGDEYLMCFSGAVAGHPVYHRAIGIARTKNLDGPWQVDPQPIVPLEEQCENTSLYFEPASQTWFLFTNHVGYDNLGEHADAIWVYWSKDPNCWDPRDKAVVLDSRNSTWSPDCIGMPSVIRKKDRLAVLYDAPGGETPLYSNMHRSIGLAWLDLPLMPPSGE